MVWIHQQGLIMNCWPSWTLSCPHKCHKETNCSFKAFPFRISKILFFSAKQLVTWEGDKIILLNETLLCLHYVNFSTNSCISTVNRSLKAKKKELLVKVSLTYYHNLDSRGNSCFALSVTADFFSHYIMSVSALSARINSARQCQVLVVVVVPNCG